MESHDEKNFASVFKLKLKFTNGFAASYEGYGPQICYCAGGVACAASCIDGRIKRCRSMAEQVAGAGHEQKLCGSDS